MNRKTENFSVHRILKTLLSNYLARLYLYVTLFSANLVLPKYFQNKYWYMNSMWELLSNEAKEERRKKKERKKKVKQQGDYQKI